MLIGCRRRGDRLRIEVWDTGRGIPPDQQQNIFNSTCSINQQSSGGYFMLGFNSNDQFNDEIIVSSTGTGGIY